VEVQAVHWYFLHELEESESFTEPRALLQDWLPGPPGHTQGLLLPLSSFLCPASSVQLPLTMEVPPTQLSFP
jgi:hypothetical protein